MAAGDTLQGRRVENLQEASGPDGFIPGCYWFVEPGHAKVGRELWLVDPTGHVGRVPNHTVTEFEDGTVTVSPSILTTSSDHGHDWHGYLEQGVWREV
jgi:hypothetical protein